MQQASSTSKEILSESINTIDEYIEKQDWRINGNANISYSFGGMILHVAGKASAKYWLERVYNKKIRNAHISGDLHLHDLDFLAGYSYFGKETILTRYRGTVLYTSFERLYDIVTEPECTFNGHDGAFAKYPKSLYIYDKTGWTIVTRVIRKRRDTGMSFIKSSNGYSQIVTDNHPMICNNGETRACDIIVFKDRIATIEDDIDFGEKNYISFPAIMATPDISLDSDIGWLLGLILADSSVPPSEGIGFTQKTGDILDKAIAIMVKRALPCSINKTGNPATATVHIRSQLFQNLYLYLFGDNITSESVHMPDDFMNYNKEFIKGIISGIIDGDSAITGGSHKVTIRLTSRTFLNQVAYILRKIGHRVRDLTPCISNRAGAGSESNFYMYGISCTLLSDIGFLYSIKLKDIAYKYDSISIREKANRRYTVVGDGVLVIKKESLAPIGVDTVYDITTETNTFICNGIYSHNCSGWSLRDLIYEGFGGIGGKISASPAKHFSSILGQIVNFLGTLQNEWAGAQAFSSFDTFLAPFVKNDNLSKEQVEQEIQEFLFSLNVASRWGMQTPFTNLTFDIAVPKSMEEEHPIIGGEIMEYTYNDCQKEMDLINNAFLSLMIKGDTAGRIFSFPIPTYNITDKFDWDGEVAKNIFIMTAKYGVPYFQNFINSDLDPEHVRSMCCRLRLDKRELLKHGLLKRGGGLFGSAELTGSLGVCTINCARIGYIAKGTNYVVLLELLDNLLDIAIESLERKRAYLTEQLEKGLFPYTQKYMKDGYDNYFSTVGVNGINEMVRNFTEDEHDIATVYGKKLAEGLLKYINLRLREAQLKTGNLYNLEATPAEGCTYRFAKADRGRFRDIITAGTASAPYYSNSSQLPVAYTNDPVKALDHQESLQRLYTGGTVFHLYLGEAIEWKSCRDLVKRVLSNYQIPYLSITPTFSICPVHGYIKGEVEKCERCGNECEIWTRVVGFYRPINNYNIGKRQEFTDRKYFDQPTL